MGIKLRNILMGTWILFTACSVFRELPGENDAAKTEVKNMTNQNKEKNETVEEMIIALGRRASSSHNCQPWEIVKNQDKGNYETYSVKERWLPKVDPENREIMLSFGALIKNLEMSARAYGYQMEFNLTAKSAKDREIGNFRLKEIPGVEKDLKSINILKSIYNEKGKYSKGQIDSEMDDFLKNVDDEGEVLFFSRESGEYQLLKKGSMDANHSQAWRDDVQSELADFICYSVEDEKRGIGLTPEMLRLPGFMKRSWYKKSSRESVMNRTFRNGTKGVVKRQINNSSGFLVITNKNNSVEELIRAGGKYQKILFEARKRHWEIQPISQILEEDPWRNEIGKELGLNNPVQFILRVGYIKGEKPDYSADAVSSASIRIP